MIQHLRIEAVPGSPDRFDPHRLIGVAFDLGRAFARELSPQNFALESLLPSAYFPSPLGDTSHLHYFQGLIHNMGNAWFAYAETALVVPLVWSALAFVLAQLLFSRRAVP